MKRVTGWDVHKIFAAESHRECLRLNGGRLQGTKGKSEAEE
jgi:hypothetical protein